MSAAGTPQLVLVGATHHTAPLEVRERLALSREKQLELLHALRAGGVVSEFCAINTCNRVELYATTPAADAVTRISGEFCRVLGLPVAEFTRASLKLHGADVVRHLFEVASGLDSQMVGEAEILGQVKDAYAAAQTAGTAGTVLNRIFQKAFQSAKLVRTETAIGEGQVSVASVAVDLANKIFGQLQRSRVLVVGAGDIAEKTARALQSREAGDVTFSNRTRERAVEFAQAFSGRVLDYEQLAGGLAAFDIVVSSTSAPDPVIRAPHVSEAMRTRPSRPLFLIDLALPRDIESAVADLPNVLLYNLDDLARIADENIALRKAEIIRARAMLLARADATWQKVAGNSTGFTAPNPAPSPHAPPQA